MPGKTGDQINTLLAAAGYNLRKQQRWIVFSPVLALFQWLEAVLKFNSPLKLASNEPGIEKPKFAQYIYTPIVSDEDSSGTTS